MACLSTNVRKVNLSTRAWYVVAKIKPGNSGLYGIQTLDLCDAHVPLLPLELNKPPEHGDSVDS